MLIYFLIIFHKIIYFFLKKKKTIIIIIIRCDVLGGSSYCLSSPSDSSLDCSGSASLIAFRLLQVGGVELLQDRHGLVQGSELRADRAWESLNHQLVQVCGLFLFEVLKRARQPF